MVSDSPFYCIFSITVLGSGARWIEALEEKSIYPSMYNSYHM